MNNSSEDLLLLNWYFLSILWQQRLIFAGDSLANANKVQYIFNGMMFSTHNDDNDSDWRNCAVVYTGDWWYNACHYSNLNGAYSPVAVQGYEHNLWRSWRDKDALKATTMMIREKY
jgi:hypothetical protein